MEPLAFSRYDHYKQTGNLWIGEVPSHWQIQPGLAVLTENKQKNTGMVEKTVLSLSYGRVIVKPPEKLTGLVPESFETYQVIKPNDIIIRPTDLQNDHTSLRTGLAKDHGIITSAYICLRPVSAHNPTFLHYLLHAYDLMKVFYGMGSGLRQNLDYRDFKRLELCLPPRDEQDRIANFLDQKTAEIDEAIAKKQRLIELLKEQKTILINQIVTKGLNPDAPMRDSGVEWIGEIPKHWKIKKFKYCCGVVSGQVNPRKEPYSSMALIAPNHIESATGRLLAIETAKDQEADSGKYLVKKGDIVYSKIRPALQKACISPVDGICSADMYVLNPANFLHPEFLLHYILTDAFTLPALDAAMRVAMPKVNRDALGAFPILLPPLEEQIEIIEKIYYEKINLDDAIVSLSGQIEFLREYREILIFNTVTGKIKPQK